MTPAVALCGSATSLLLRTMAKAALEFLGQLVLQILENALKVI